MDDDPHLVIPSDHIPGSLLHSAGMVRFSENGLIKRGDSCKYFDKRFRTGGTRKFFVEAKKPSVNITEDIGRDVYL